MLDGVDVSGHWSTFIESRVVTDYNEALEDEIAALPGGEHIHRCWQCGSCTNSCTVNADQPGLQSALLDLPDPHGHGIRAPARQGDHLAVRLVQQMHLRLPARRCPEGVMKATAHWLELKGHTPKSPSTIFDDVFTEQVVDTGKIEEGRVVREFFARTGAAAHAGLADRDGESGWRICPSRSLRGSDLPASFVRAPATGRRRARRSRSMSTSRRSQHRKALGLDGLVEMAKGEVAMMPAHRDESDGGHQMKDVAEHRYKRRSPTTRAARSRAPATPITARRRRWARRSASSSRRSRTGTAAGRWR